MNIENVLVRNFYEEKGDFAGIETTLGNLYKNLNITEDLLYESIGFEGYKDYSPKQVYEITKTYLLNGKYDNTNRDINEILARVKKVKIYHAKQYKLNKELILAKDYLTKSDNTIYQGRTIGDFLNILGSVSKADFNEIDGKEIIKNIKQYMPVLVCNDSIEEPVLVGNTILTNSKITNNQRKDFYKNLVDILMFNADSVDKTFRNKCLKTIDKPVSLLAETDSDLYMQLVCNSIVNNTTINELLENTNIYRVNFIEQYIKYRCIFYDNNGRINLEVFDNNESLNIDISLEGLCLLISTDTISYMYIENGILKNSANMDLLSMILGGTI